MNTTIVHRDTFLSFTPNGSGIEVYNRTLLLFILF
jgi:hypothetical protein